jgi:lipoprotein-anchoring transpeptidase ErfK/SrfK
MRNISFLLVLIIGISACESHTTSTTNSATTDSVVRTQPAVTDTVRRSDTMSQQPVRSAVLYRLVKQKDSIRSIVKYYDPLPVLLAVNRTDSAHISQINPLVVPNGVSDINAVSPFPQQVPQLQQVDKIVFFSYPAQYFAAYERGRMVRSGPTNMGRKKDPTPTGLFYANWKAEETRSTFNDEWELKWNFNIENKQGVGWHQYAMPGYPASHSCLRLRTDDARYLYDWADEWIMKGGKTVAQGTPVVVFGEYPFDGPKPWLQLTSNSHALDITADQMMAEVQPRMNEIMAEQQKRGNAGNSTAKTTQR